MTTLSPSLWLRDRPVPGPALSGDTTCDVAVIGAGYTGLSAAIALAESGASVVVLESEYAGFGASGRSAGHLTPTIGKDLPSVLKAYGLARGRALVRLAETAIDFTESVLADHRIDCDFVPHGNVIAGIHPGQDRKLRHAADAAQQLGAAVRMLERKEIDGRGLPAFISCAAIEERGGILDPGKYVRGLRDVAISSGATLYEGTPVVEVVEHRRGVLMNTPEGSVSAPVAVLATNAYTPTLGLSYGGVVPMRDSQFVTAPLSTEQRQRIGWPGAEGVYTAHESLENYRLTAEGRIVGGSRYVGYRMRGRIAPDEDRRAFARIEALFRQRFPNLDDVPVEAYWSGHVAMNSNFVPFIGRVGKHGKLVAALGYCGHGIALAGYLGTLAAGIAQGTASPPDVLNDIRRIPLPPEPFRWLAVRAITTALEAVDQRTDRRATPRH
jgi:gamma-glutamylputrescine oxidase